MRTLTTSIQNALAAPERAPAISAQLFDPIAHFASYQTGGLLEGISAACVANDGSLIRAFTTQSVGAFAASLDVQRITDPGNSAQWNTWVNLSSSNLMRDAGCTLSNNGTSLRLFAQSGASPFNLLVWTSTDNGVTWSGPVSIAAINAIVRGLGTGGHDDIFYAYDITGGVALAVSRWSGGSWSSPSTWTLGVIPASAGIDAAWDATLSRYLLAVSDGFSITGYSYTPSSSAWGFVSFITSLDSDITLGLERAYPRLHIFDGLYSLSYLE